jgi:hypothetical protein
VRSILRTPIDVLPVRHTRRPLSERKKRRSHNLPPTMANRSLEEEKDANAFELIK